MPNFLARRKLIEVGLQAMVPFWKEALEMVLDVEPGRSHYLGWVCEADLEKKKIPQRYPTSLSSNRQLNYFTVSAINDSSSPK